MYLHACIGEMPTLNDKVVKQNGNHVEKRISSCLVDGQWDKAKFLLHVTEENNLTHFVTQFSG